MVKLVTLFFFFISDDSDIEEDQSDSEDEEITGYTDENKDWLKPAKTGKLDLDEVRMSFL